MRSVRKPANHDRKQAGKMSDKPPHTPRTPHAEAAIRAAHLRVYALIDDPVACMEQLAPLVLASVAPAQRGDALLAFRAVCHSEPDRVALVLWAYQGALQLYDAGAFDEPAA
jgi:hypothetical protein